VHINSKTHHHTQIISCPLLLLLHNAVLHTVKLPSEIPPLLHLNILSASMTNSNVFLVVHGVTWPLNVQVLPSYFSPSNTSKLIQNMLIMLPQLGRIFTVLIISMLFSHHLQRLYYDGCPPTLALAINTIAL
jgi:hypothetical protein